MPETIEEGLSKLERDVALLKSQSESGAARAGWITDVMGSFKDDPDFDEILRLGKKIRDADQDEEA
jgi:hypothetical protein